MIGKTVLYLMVGLFFFGTAYAENRAYLLDVFDHITNDQWTAYTAFSPDKYIITHGGGNRLSVMVKATWMCYGDTSSYKPVCPMPKPKNPKFKVGDKVEVLLEKHITQGWVGTVELSLYRDDLKSNVYGVRFSTKRKLYNRYYEFNLKLKKAFTVISPPLAETSPEGEQPTPQQ